LGIDLIPLKTCSFDCIYCQLGRTTDKTIRRGEYAPARGVLSEIAAKLKERPGIDCLTFSGSGEPTLNQNLGQIIKGIRMLSGLPVAVITNGSLLWSEDVQKNLLAANIVLPTLSTADPKIFKKIHRPDPGLKLDKIIQGMASFRKKFSGSIWLEVFIVKGINDREKDMEALKRVLDGIKPDKIQLNTSARIPSEKYSLSASKEKMEKLAAIFGERAEVIADFKRRKIAKAFHAGESDVLNYLRRRPGTIDDISAGLGISKARARGLLQSLLAEKRISAKSWQERLEYFFIK